MVKKATSKTAVKKLNKGPDFNLVISLVVMGLLLGLGYILLTARASVTVKQQIGGTIDRDSPPPASYQGVVTGWVVQAYWKDLQPSAGGAIAGGNAIDKALAQARQLNQAHPGLNMRLKLRVYGGIYAPGWAKNIGGAPYTINNDRGSTDHGGTVGRFWLPAYGQAYQDLQNKLAAKYDNVPEIREVVVSRCTTVFAEPFIREIDQDSNLQAYRQAGYTEAADQQCQREEIGAHQAWQATRSSLDVTPYQYITASGSGTDVNFSLAMMDYCRKTLGSRCVLGNNSLQSGTQGAGFQQIYDKLKAIGAPVYFQTATQAKIGDWQAALQKGIDAHAGMVELPAGYQNNFPLNQLAGYDSKLEAQAVSDGTVTSPPAPPPPPPDTTQPPTSSGGPAVDTVNSTDGSNPDCSIDCNLTLDQFDPGIPPLPVHHSGLRGIGDSISQFVRNLINNILQALHLRKPPAPI